MIRLVALGLVVLLPSLALAQGTPDGRPVVFFSIFGPDGEKLQRFYADVFEWKIAASGDVATAVSAPLPATIGKGMAETIVYVGVDDIDATLKKVVAGGGSIRFGRTEVPGRVVLAVFHDPAGNGIGLVEMENGKAKVPK